MPINASYEFINAEKDYLNAKGLEDKIYYLEEMIKAAPKHKSSENLLKELRVRLKKFKEKLEKGKKKSGGRKGIRKEGFQFVLVGKTNGGKSLLLRKLTNAKPLVAEYKFTTKVPEIGTYRYEGISAQMIDLPSIGSEFYDIGLVNTADCLLIVVEELEELKDIEEYIKRSKGCRIVLVNKADRFDERALRILKDKIKSKRIDGLVVSAESGYGLDDLKSRMFKETGLIRVYMKEPGKKKETKPMVLKSGSIVKDVAEHILKGFSSRVKETRLTGPSGKFRNQRVGLKHVMKDRDVIEFHTR